MNYEDLKYKLLDSALKAATMQKKDTKAPFMPFYLVMNENGKIVLHHVQADRFEVGVEMAHKLVAHLDPIPDFSVIVYDGFIPLNETKKEAIILKLFEKQKDSCIVFGQAYNPKGLLKKFRLIGGPKGIRKEKNIMGKGDKIFKEEPKKEVSKEEFLKMLQWAKEKKLLDNFRIGDENKTIQEILDNPQDSGVSSEKIEIIRQILSENE